MQFIVDRVLLGAACNEKGRLVYLTALDQFVLSKYLKYSFTLGNDIIDIPVYELNNVKFFEANLN